MISIVPPAYNSAKYPEERFLSFKGLQRWNFEYVIMYCSYANCTLNISAGTKASPQR